MNCVSLSSLEVTEQFHDQNLSKDKTVNPILHLLCQWLYYIATNYLTLMSIKKKVSVVSSFPGLPIIAALSSIVLIADGTAKSTARE